MKTMIQKSLICLMLLGFSVSVFARSGPIWPPYHPCKARYTATGIFNRHDGVMEQFNPVSFTLTPADNSDQQGSYAIIVKRTQGQVTIPVAAGCYHVTAVPADVYISSNRIFTYLLNEGVYCFSGKHSSGAFVFPDNFYTE